jgi:hypothetical protein
MNNEKFIGMLETLKAKIKATKYINKRKVLILVDNVIDNVKHETTIPTKNDIINKWTTSAEDTIKKEIEKTEKFFGSAK